LRPKLVGTSIAKAVKEELDGDSLLQEALARGIVNMSAVARTLKPAVEARVGGDVSEVAIVTSIKRVKGAYRRRALDYLRVLAKSSVEVRTDLAIISIQSGAETVSKVKEVAIKNYASFVQISSSPAAHTLVFDTGLFGYVKARLGDEGILEAKTDMAAMIIHSPEEISKTPGCIAAIYSKLARTGINVVDTVSNYVDTIIVVKMADIVKAFTAVTELINEARRSGVDR